MCDRNPWRTSRKGNKLITHKPDCLCWKCSDCRPKMQERWIKHVTACFQECGTCLVVVTVPADSFSKFARKLNRRDADYARVRQGLEIVAFVATNNLDILDMGDEVSPLEASELFAGLVNGIENSNGGNPVSTCRAWSQPQRDHSDWDLIAVGPSPAAVRSAAFLVLADFVERSIGGTPVAICRGTTLQVDKLCELIGSLATGSPIAKENHHGNSDTDSDDYFPFGGQPDESPIPYTVGAVT